MWSPGVLRIHLWLTSTTRYTANPKHFRTVNTPVDKCKPNTYPIPDHKISTNFMQFHRPPPKKKPITALSWLFQITSSWLPIPFANSTWPCLSHPGERFDFILETSQAVGNYWLQGWPIGECGETAAVYAIIRYEGAAQSEPTEDKNLFNSKKVTQFWAWRQISVLKTSLLTSLEGVSALRSSLWKSKHVSLVCVLFWGAVGRFSLSSCFQNEPHWFVNTMKVWTSKVGSLHIKRKGLKFLDQLYPANIFRDLPPPHNSVQISQTKSATVSILFSNLRNSTVKSRLNTMERRNS